MLSVNGLSVAYGGTTALAGVSADCDAGAVVAVVGPNGAGKSTLLRTIATALADGSNAEVTNPAVDGARTSGRVAIDVPAPAAADCESLVAWCPDATASFLDLSPLENADLLLLALGIAGRERTERLAILRRILELGRDVDRPVGELSLGMRKRTDIALAVLRRSAVYLFDEPYNGLDADWVFTFGELIRSIATAGHTVLVASHAVDLLLPHCDSLWELDGGKIASVRRGNPGSFTPSDLSHLEAGRQQVGTLPWL